MLWHNIRPTRCHLLCRPIQRLGTFRYQVRLPIFKHLIWKLLSNNETGLSRRARKEKLFCSIFGECKTKVMRKHLVHNAVSRPLCPSILDERIHHSRLLLFSQIFSAEKIVRLTLNALKSQIFREQKRKIDEI